MEINSRELDRYITGNYGEDQFIGLKICQACEDEFYPDQEPGRKCPYCGWEAPDDSPD